MTVANRGDAIVEFQRIHMLLRKHKDEEARRLLVEEKTGRLKAIFRPFANHAWYLLGDIAYSARDFETAAECFRKSVRADNNDLDAYLALANSHSELGQHAEVVRILRKAIARFRRAPQLKYNLANAYFNLGRFDEAGKYYRLTIKAKSFGIGLKSRRNLELLAKKRADATSIVR